MQKFYCYVDETGQDDRSSYFFVVVVASDNDQGILREQLIKVENVAQTGGLKWHKTQSKRRLSYLKEVIARKICQGELFFSIYLKPIPYFFPMLDVLEYAIRKKAVVPYITRIYIDGIDKKKARELTNALRSKNISLELIKSCRDESEPLIRLADMWAGCIRAAKEGKLVEKSFFVAALNSGYLEELPKQKNPL